MNDGKNRYADIIGLPHPVSAVHPRMPLLQRAAQFAPFAALTGYDAAVLETARLTQEQKELDEDQLQQLNARLVLAKAHCRERPELTVVYFRPDERKAGGAYTAYTGCLKRVDEVERLLLFADGTRIPIDAIRCVEGDLFAEDAEPGLADQDPFGDME